MNLYISTIKRIVTRIPAVVPYLKGMARWVAYAIARPPESFNNPIYSKVRRFKAEFQSRLLMIGIDPDGLKTYDYMLRQIEGLVQGVYDNNVGSDFIDIMANLISGQLTQAYSQAWEEEGSEGALPDYLNDSLENMILGQFDYVDNYYADIVNARELELPIEPLLSRATVWANQWQSAYNEAVRLIALNNGGKLEWVFGDTEHCDVCNGLNGIVAFAVEWDTSGVRPQNPPNDALTCGGWRCQCSLEVTDKRRTRGAFDKIQSIIAKG